MRREDFLKLLEEKVILLDGGYGTEFFKRGYGHLPGEVLNLQAPEVVADLHREYVRAGARIILTNTFSANLPKLSSLGYADYFREINLRAVAIARKAAGDQALVFGDVSSLGVFPQPIGELDFEDSVRAYAEQAEILSDSGVDGFIIETMTDLKELKAAILGIRSVSEELPLIAQMTFDQSLRTVTGTSVAIFGTTLEDLDVDVIGINCSLGPAELIPVLKELTNYTTKPLSVEPNAGQPEYDGIDLVYNLQPEHFAIYMEDFIDLGVNILGGCCGTSPKHIRALSSLLRRERKPIIRERSFTQALASRTIYQTLDPFAIIGERINPASRKHFQQEIIAQDYQTIVWEMIGQQREGTGIVDLNLGVEKLLTREHFKEVILELDRRSTLPISFDIQTFDYLETALREFPGRPLINSAQVTERSLERATYLLKKYGGMLILLAMGKKIPETGEERFDKVMEGISILEANGISRERIFADPLVLSLGAKKDPRGTLRTIELLSEAGVRTTMGLSNLSFGLPERSKINGAYLAQAVEKGVKSAIMNSGDSFVMGSLTGALSIRGESLVEKESYLTDDPLVDSLLAGDVRELQQLIEEELTYRTPLEISEIILGKAMEIIGNLYNDGEIYLPHLLLASQTAQPIFEHLQTLTTEERNYQGKVVMATVEGDIHDIGKSIVATVLKSGGFQVIDAGKDLPAEQILQIVQEEEPDILGLSAMMTTTVGRVEEMMRLLNEVKSRVRLIAGGASMNYILAEKFGCEYAQNASTALELCKRLMVEIRSEK